MSAERTRASLLSGVVLLAATGCDVPTELPRWDTRWVVPGERTRIGSDAFLPDGVTLAGDGTAFLVELERVLDGRSLGELCELCVPLDGTTAPKPAFESSFSNVLPVPPDIEEALMEEGRLVVRLENGFNFDPIRPGADPGSLGIEVREGGPDGRLLADTVVSGVDEDFPPGSVRSVSLALAPGPVLESLVVALSIDSPEGDPVEIRADDRLEAHFRPDPLRVVEALIRTAGTAVTLESSDLGVEGLDARLVDRVTGGAAEVEVANPFDLTVDLTLRIHGPETPDLVRTITVAPGTTTTRLDFTGEELRSFLGRPGVVLEGGGVVRADAPPTRITPTDEVRLRVDLDLTLRMGGDP